MGAALIISVASAKLSSLNPPTPTSSERALLGYYGILWVSMEINGILRNNCGKNSRIQWLLSAWIKDYSVANAAKDIKRTTLFVSRT